MRIMYLSTTATTSAATNTTTTIKRAAIAGYYYYYYYYSCLNSMTLQLSLVGRQEQSACPGGTLQQVFCLPHLHPERPQRPHPFTCSSHR